MSAQGRWSGSVSLFGLLKHLAKRRIEIAGDIAAELEVHSLCPQVGSSHPFSRG